MTNAERERQPDTTTNDSIPVKNGRNDEDRTSGGCISRTQAIEPEAISRWKKEFREYVNSLDIARDDWKGIIEYIDELPSVQPDVIKCKDCEYLCNEDGLRGMCWHINGFGTDIKDKYNSFCSWAERRRGEQ